MNSVNVKIPLKLLNDIVCLLEFYYTLNDRLELASDFIAYLDSMLLELHIKQRSLDRRTAYSKILSAKTEMERDVARIDYLRLKREIERFY